ncbi:MAG: MoaD/ThiS family protein [Elusimicrobia bacterium]|nr:MoaD/ThiS family protein [Elusimicrobiota bacterium]
MAKVTVAVYTTLRDKLGFSRKDFDGKNLGEIIKQVCALKKGISEILMEDKNKIKNHFVLTLNSEIIDSSSFAKIKVKDGDIFHIFPPVSGG